MQTPLPFTTSLFTLITAVTLLGVAPAQARDAFFGQGPKAKARDGHRDRHAQVAMQPGRSGGQRVEVDLSTQKLRAWEGDRLVMQTRISSGRNDATPTGRFSTGIKSRHHYSSLYHNAYMPWSVQVAGDVFIHGYESVPRYPASHGCIRLPVTGSNPAKRFYEWVRPGTAVRIIH